MCRSALTVSLLSVSLSLILSSECPVLHLLLSDSPGHRGQNTKATENFLLSEVLDLGQIIIGDVIFERHRDVLF